MPPWESANVAVVIELATSFIWQASLARCRLGPTVFRRLPGFTMLSEMSLVRVSGTRGSYHTFEPYVAEYLLHPQFTSGRLRAGTEVADVEASLYAVLVALLTGWLGGNLCLVVMF